MTERNSRTTQFARCLGLGALLISILGCSTVVHDDTQQRKILQDKVVGSYRWIMTAPSGVNFTLAQRLPDQTRSFYLARGFTSAAANSYAISCVFQTIVHNDTKKSVVAFNLADWRIIENGHERPLKLTSQWQQDWKKMGLPKSAQIAFQWSQFPTIQKHNPGDWFQGMIAAGLPPGSTFGVKIVWTQDGVPHQAKMTDIQCPKDRTIKR